MNIRESLLKERVHTKAQALEIARYACASAGNFKKLMHCFLQNEYRLAQRAAWSVSWAAREQPALIRPHLKDIVAQLSRKDVHPAVLRNSVRILEAVDIPEDLHAAVMNACFQFIETPATPVATKAFSLTTLYNLSQLYPETGQELKLIIEDRWDHETAAFKSRGRKIVKALEGKGKNYG